jgi:NTE family protein
MPEVMSTDVPTDTGAHRNLDLVLEGGGVKGIGLVGAVLTLADAGYRFPRVAGTSAGAISAALIAALQRAGKPLAQLRDFVDSVDYSKFEQRGFIGRRLGVAADAESLSIHDGLYTGDYLVEWLGGLLEQIGVTTFAELRLADPGSPFPADRDYALIVHTADLTRGKLVRLPWDYPDYGFDPETQRIVDAVRASMSIPFFFRPVRHDVPAATFDGVDYPAGTVTWVDGGLLSNFPVEVFDRSDGSPARWPTLGIKLSARDMVIAPPHEHHGPLAEGLACVRVAVDNADRYYLAPDAVARTIFIDTDHISSTDFHLTAEQRQTLYANGQQAARDWLAAQQATG